MSKIGDVAKRRPIGQLHVPIGAYHITTSGRNGLLLGPIGTIPSNPQIKTTYGLRHV